MRTLLPLLALALLGAPSRSEAPAAEDPSPAGSPPDAGTRVILVAREEVRDPGLRARLAALGGEDARRCVVALGEPEEHPRADWVFARDGLEGERDREIAAAIEACDVLVLRGGTFMGWYESLRPAHRRTQVHDALLHVVRSRRTVLAYGGAAAFLSSGTTIARAELDEPARNPRRAKTQVARVAMGLGPPLILDGDGFSQGSPLRWLHSAWRLRLDLGAYLVGDVALVHLWQEQELRVWGPGSVVLADLGRARRFKRRFEGLRLTRLEDGDGWDFAHDALLAGEGVERGPVREADRVVPATRVGLGAGAALSELLRCGAPEPRGPLPPGDALLELERAATSERWQRGERATWAAVTARLSWTEPLFEPPALETPANDVH